MTPEDFTHEALLLAREAVFFAPGAGNVGAKWIDDEFGSRPLVSLDCALLPHEPLPGILALYSEGPSARFEPGPLVPSADAVSLAGYPARSLPPVDAVFRFGSPSVRDWLLRVGWQPDWEFNPNFPDLEVVDPYLELFESECPLYRNDVWAVTGGWHFPWPDGDWADVLESRLLLWTLHEAEPWYEVWFDGETLKVLERIT